jgi:hypothetical protein
LFLASSVAAQACSFKHLSDEELVAKSKTIFWARVTETRLTTLQDPTDPKRSFEVVEARYEVKEVFKGEPPASGVIRDLPYGPGNCSLGLMPGVEYVFIPGEYDMVLLPTGSFGHFNPEGRTVAPRLKAIRKLASPSK